jgi:hypothetical protein
MRLWRWLKWRWGRVTWLVEGVMDLRTYTYEQHSSLNRLCGRVDTLEARVKQLLEVLSKRIKKLERNLDEVQVVLASRFLDEAEKLPDPPPERNVGGE